MDSLGCVSNHQFSSFKIMVKFLGQKVTYTTSEGVEIQRSMFVYLLTQGFIGLCIKVIINFVSYLFENHDKVRWSEIGIPGIWYKKSVVLSSRTDFFVDMSGQISSRRRQLSTKQWSGNKCSDILTKIQLRVTWWIIGTSQVNSGGLSVKHAAALAWQRAFRKQSSIFEGLFLSLFCFNVSFHFQIVHCYVGHVIFSQNCCFVANFVNKVLVDNSTKNQRAIFNKFFYLLAHIASLGCVSNDQFHSALSILW